MTQNFELKITAVDAATAVFRKFGASVGKAMRPAVEAQKTIDRIGSGANLKKQTRELDGVARSLAGIARIGESAGLRIPLLGGLGGGFAIGAGIEGFVSMMRESSTQATKVLRFQQQHGMSMREIQRLTAAAGREGLDEGSAQDAIGSFGGKLNDMAAGRDGGLGRMLLRRAGVELEKNADGSPNTYKAFLDIADAVKRQKNPEAAGFLANQFGLGSLLPLLQDGSAQIRKFGEEAERTGQIMSKEGIKSLDDYARSVDNLSASIKAVRNSMTGGSASTLAPGINTFAGGINKATENSGKRSFFDQMMLPLRTLLGAFELGQSMANVPGSAAAPSQRRMSGTVTGSGSPISRFGAGMQGLNSGLGASRIDPAEQHDRDIEGLRIIQSELDKEQDPSNRAALSREIARIQASMSASGTGSLAPASAAASAGSAGPQQVKVEVSVGDDRTRVKTTTTGGGQAPTTRVAFAMPTSGVR